MDSRERTFIALDHQEPDRVPLDCWVSKGTKHKINTKMQLSYDDFLDKYDIDLRYIEGPEYIGPSLKTDRILAIAFVFKAEFPFRRFFPL